MRYATLVARFLLGLTFVVFGLNTFLWAVFNRAFMEPPKEMPAAAAAFLKALTDAGFMHPLRSVVEFFGGLMVLTGIMAPLGLLILAPVLVHIVLYHHYMDPPGLVIAYVLVALELFLAYAYSPAFRGLLNPLAKTRWHKADRGTPDMPMPVDRASAVHRSAEAGVAAAETSMRRWVVLVTLTILGTLTAFAAYYPFSPWARQRHNMRIAAEHVPKVLVPMRIDPRFRHVRPQPFTGSGGSLLLLGKVRRGDLVILKQLVESTSPPVTVAWFVEEVPPEEYDRL